MQYSVAKSTTALQLHYRCRRCGHTCPVTSVGQSEVAIPGSSDASAQAASRSAASSARYAASMAVRLARCPSCGRSDPAAKALAALGALFKAALAGVVAACAAQLALGHLTWPTAIAIATGTLVACWPIAYALRLRSARRDVIF